MPADPPSHAVTQSNGAGIALRVAAMACMAVLAALVKACAERGAPVLEIIFFRNAFAFVPVLFYISRTSSYSILKTSRPGGHGIEFRETSVHGRCASWSPGNR